GLRPSTPPRKGTIGACHGAARRASAASALPSVAVRRKEGDRGGAASHPAVVQYASVFLSKCCSMASAIQIIPVRGIGDVRPGDDLASLILGALEGAAQPLEDSDVLVVTQKVVSKAEGRLVDPSTVEPSHMARMVAAQGAKDAHHYEVVLRETRRIVRMDRGVLICETHHGLVCANAGVDESNVAGGRMLTLLPEDPDASAERLRRAARERAGVDIAVIISDTFGRPWREGQVNVAIG